MGKNSIMYLYEVSQDVSFKISKAIRSDEKKIYTKSGGIFFLVPPKAIGSEILNGRFWDALYLRSYTIYVCYGDLLQC